MITTTVGNSERLPVGSDGSIIVDQESGALRVKLQGVNVDAGDLFTGVSSELEQRHEGLSAEIG